jgi:membrane-associated phospholipid phosphatase
VAYGAGSPLALALLLVLLGISRIYLEAHYLTDVLAGLRPASD